MLKYTKVEIELLTDVDMLMFVERGIRGGISQCSHRYAKANNKYMDAYDPKEPSSYLMYLDVNNLYGFAMTRRLPLKNFKWIDSTDVDEKITEILGTSNDSSIGYILEVDLEYPENLHDQHIDYPFCDESMPPPSNPKGNIKLMLTLHLRKRIM